MTKSLPQKSEALLLEMFGSYPSFLRETWKEMGWAKYHRLTEIELDIAAFVQQPDRKKVVLAPRGMGKTHIVSVCLGLWWLYRDPNNKIVVVSKSEIHAKNIIGAMRAAIDRCWFLNHLKPNKTRMDSTLAFVVGQAEDSVQPSVVALGVESQLAGRRGTLVIADDIETKENVATPEGRERLLESAKELDTFLYPGVDGAMVVFVGTFQHEQSVYIKLADMGATTRTWPIEYPRQGDHVLGLAPIFADRLAANPDLAGKNAMPHRYSEEEIKNHRAKGARYYAMQYRLLASLGTIGMRPLRLEDLIVHPVDPKVAPIHIGWGVSSAKGTTEISGIPSLGYGVLRGPCYVDPEVAPYSGTRAFIDPGGRGRDETAVCIVGHLAGRYYVKALVGFEGGTEPEKLRRIAELLREKRCSEVWYETNIDVFGGFGSALSIAVNSLSVPKGNPEYPEGWSCRVLPMRRHGRKEQRIVNVLEPMFSGHRIVVDPSALWPDPEKPAFMQLQYQIGQFDGERGSIEHDDRLDALCGAIECWKETAATDPVKASQGILDQMFDRKPKKTNWLRHA